MLPPSEKTDDGPGLTPRRSSVDLLDAACVVQLNLFDGVDVVVERLQNRGGAFILAGEPVPLAFAFVPPLRNRSLPAISASVDIDKVPCLGLIERDDGLRLPE